jgi:flagellar M-ring protein FliF
MLARDGLPAGGSIGYEIFDRGESLTTTPFQQDVNRLRALEGEIARTIRGLSGVRSVRVHLVLPRREPFQRDRGEAQASVVLTMQGSQRLDREGVQSVLHLVAAAVPSLRPQNISIVDSRGELLSRGGQATGAGQSMASGEELRRAHEARIARGIEDLLERTLGQGRVRVEASVEMDFDRVETREERFDPDNQVARSTQAVNEQSRSSEGGTVSVANQLPGGQQERGGGPTSNEQRSEETTNFEIGRTVRNSLREAPQLRRLSVAVLVDGAWEPGANGGPAVFRDRTPEELQRIVSLARSAAGFDERRGDRIEVVSMRFAVPEEGNEGAGGLLGLGVGPAQAFRFAESLLLALVALLAVLLVGRPVATKLSASLVPRTALAGAAAGMAGAVGGAGGAQAVVGPDGVPALVGADGVPALPGAEGSEEAMVTLAKIEGQMRASSIAKLIQLVEKHPDEALNVIRRWLTPEEGR